MIRSDFKRFVLQLFAFVSLCVTLSDKDSQLIHKLNEGKLLQLKPSPIPDHLLDIL